jgi:phytoene dehydrogenase-like protein
LSITRKEFLAGAATLLGGRWLAACRVAPAREITGSIVGAAHKVGHLLRGGRLPAPSSERSIGVLIAGAGMSGLSAAWKLRKAGYDDFEVCDLETQAGGNSRWGENEVSAYPWGAHYLPLPRSESKAVRELLRELKVETGVDAAGRPVYDPRFLRFAPAERIYIHGRWREGLFPRSGASTEDLRQLTGFEAEMELYRNRRGKDGRHAFDIPLELSSQDPGLLALDNISMGAWLRMKGFDSERLHWYVEYACRDDYGGNLNNVSAWAGIHYFAARDIEDEVLTWPEGNGWLAKRLAQPLGPRLRTGQLILNIAHKDSSVQADVLDVASGKVERLHAKAAAVCLPRYVAARIVEPLRRNPEALKDFAYAPWMTANLTIDNPPAGNGFEPAWDNVIYESDSLGWVDATHQSRSQDRRRAVWTYYLPFPGDEPAAQRRAMLETPWAQWKDRVLNDLERAAPGLRSRVRNLDVMLWGHGMIRPSVGFMWGQARRGAAKPQGPIYFGHSDLSGLSIFEEAQYRGVRAAEGILSRLGRSFASSL